MSRSSPFRGTVLAALLLAAVVHADARASELIARNATGVKLQADAQGRALISFRSEGQSRQLLAFGAVNARPPSQAQPQVAFKLQYGGSIGPNVCGAYKGPPLAWKIAACTAPDGTHWALQAWQRMLPNYGVPATGDRAAWELRLSHWSGALPVLEIWTDWSYRRFHHLYGRLTYDDGGVFGFKSTRFGVPLDTYGRNIFVDTFGSTYGAGLEAREQLPDTQANRSVLLRLLSARPKSDRRREEVPGDRDRPRRRARRDVGRTCTRRLRHRTRRSGKHCSARGARCRPALQDQLSLTPSPKDSPNAMPGSGRNPGRWSTARDRAGGRAPRAVHRGRGDR